MAIELTRLSMILLCGVLRLDAAFAFYLRRMKKAASSRRTPKLFLPHRQHNPRRILSRVIDALSRLLKIIVDAQLVIRHELLWAARDQREPGALNLDHDAVALLERVHDARHHI